MSWSLFSDLLQSNRRESIGLLSLFQDHETFHVEEKNRTQQLPGRPSHKQKRPDQPLKKA